MDLLKKQFLYPLVIILLSLGLFSSVIIINFSLDKPLITTTKQTSALNFKAEFIKVFSMGNKRLISSLLWIQTLLESDILHYKQKDLNSWMYLRFDTITSIDPNFYQAYLYGGQYLSIIKDDDLGAKTIYEKGLRKFPDDFWLNFHCAFHYLFELGDIEKAYEHYAKIQYHPLTARYAPRLPSLTARIKASMGDLNTAYQLMLIAHQNSPEDSHLRQQIFESLYSIRAEIDLSCLNGGNKKAGKCRPGDLLGNPYLKDKNEIYYASKKWKPFKILNDKWRSK